MSASVLARPASDPKPPLKQTGAVLIAGSAALVLTGLLHPPSGDALLQTGHQLGHDWYVAHLLGVGVWPFLVAGVALAGRQVLGRSPLPAMFGWAAFLFAGGAAVGSGLYGGFVRPRLAATYQAAPAADQPMLAALYDYNTTVNETLADAYQVAVGVAITLLSVCLLRTSLRSILGWLGLLGGSMIAATFATGLLSVQAADFHVFVVVNLVVAGWLAGFGGMIMREPGPGPSSRRRNPSPSG